MKRLLALFLILVGSILPSRLTTATPSAPDEFEPGTPFFTVTSGANFPLKSTSVEAKLSGPMGHVTLVQVYQNEGKDPIEGIYTFPGSTRAAVHHSTVTIGDEVIEAKIQKREDAARQYADALTQGKTASLLNQLRPADLTLIYSRCYAMPADLTLIYFGGAFGTLVMIGFGVTSIILALVATTGPTRRRGWAIASIVCALLAIGSFALKSLVNSWFNTTTLGYECPVKYRPGVYEND